jgi:hypothetical protein
MYAGAPAILLGSPLPGGRYDTVAYTVEVELNPDRFTLRVEDQSLADAGTAGPAAVFARAP